MMEQEVIEIGSEVLIDGEIPAKVTGISIRSAAHRVSYECTWWDERTRKSEWFEPFEIQAKTEKRRTLKFVAA